VGVKLLLWGLRDFKLYKRKSVLRERKSGGGGGKGGGWRAGKSQVNSMIMMVLEKMVGE